MAAINVRPGGQNNTHQISLSGKGRKFGIKLLGGARAIVESPSSPSNIQAGADGRKFGDWDPSFSHIEVRDFEGGRGNEFYSDDPSAFYDGYGWTLSPGVWHQAPQWTFGHGFVGSDNYMPGAQVPLVAGRSVKWQSLASTVHFARSFEQMGTSYVGALLQTWIRRIGRPPAPLRAQIGTSATTAGGTGRPSSAPTVSTTLETSACEELESFIWNAQLSTTIAREATTGVNRWVELFTSVAGTEANHWEIGYNSSAASGNSSVGSTSLRGIGTSGGWAASTVHFYFRLSPAKITRKWHFFELDRAMYAVDDRADGTKPSLYINGDRGICSSGVPGSTAVLNDSTKAWSSDMWSNSSAYAIIIRGVGAGQVAKITGNGSTFLNTTWAVAPTSLSEYVIVGTNEWTRISSAIFSSATTSPVKSVAVAGDFVAMAAGMSTGIGKFRWATSLHQARRDASGGADVVDFFHDPIDGPQMWAAVSSAGRLYRAGALSTFFTSNFNWVPSSGIPVGAPNVPFTNLEDYNDQMYAFKEDSIWTIKNDRAAKLNIGLDTLISSNNGRTALAQNLFLYASWSHSLERLHGGTLDDIGPWRGAGLKPGHQGAISTAIAYIAWLLGGIDATTGISGLYAWNNRGWHEIFRGYSTGYSFDGLAYYGPPGPQPRIFMSVGGDIVSMEMPRDTLNPRNDKDLHYQHESVMEVATIDMNARRLPKLFAGLEANSKNLVSSVAQIAAEYQLGDDIGSSNWISIGQFYRSPFDDLHIRRGDEHSIRVRLRGLTQVSTTPSILEAATLKAVARSPIKRQWTLRGEMGDFQVDSQGMEDTDPDEFYMWLQDIAVTSEPLLMNAAWEALDNVYVFAESPILHRKNTTPSGEYSADFEMTLREI